MTATQLAAWGVHFYTACGAVLGFLALDATASGRYGVAFAWLSLATLVDCTDGTLARRVGVKQVLPNFDGARLDDIVDYLNYVVVPVVLAYHAGLIPHGTGGLMVAALPLLASGYGFCQLDAKTDDHFFQGFPSYWNVVVFYFYTLGTARWFNVVALIVLAILVFVPVGYVYPSKNPTFQRTTYVLGIVWGICMAVLLTQFPTPSRSLAWVSFFFPIYYMTLSVYLHLKRR